MKGYQSLAFGKCGCSAGRGSYLRKLENTAPFDLVLATGQSELVLCSAVTHLNNPIADKKNKAEGIF